MVKNIACPGWACLSLSLQSFPPHALSWYVSMSASAHPPPPGPELELTAPPPEPPKLELDEAVMLLLDEAALPLVPFAELDVAPPLPALVGWMSYPSYVHAPPTIAPTTR